jgi:NAD(P)-dependent dehydrogenase (short-subunit alcohol dehydrogenase family)
MKKALITGANKSIGFETARQLLQKEHYIYLGSRNLENGLEAVEKLKAEGLNEVEAIQIDVSDDESVKAARSNRQKDRKFGCSHQQRRHQRRDAAIGNWREHRRI